MRRTLDLVKYENETVHSFESVDAFLEQQPPDGICEILVGKHPIHALYEHRGSATTLVHFMAALPAKGWDNYPIFKGALLADKASVNRLSLSDPNYALPGRPSTGWFLGTAEQPLPMHLGAIIRHYTSRGKTGQAIMFGSSAGGFAALLYGAQIPESVTVCLNPRVDLLRMPSEFRDHAKTSFPGRSMYTISQVTDVSAAVAYRRGPGNHVAYVQNVQDHSYFDGGLLHFLGLNHARKQVFLDLIDSGPGHRLPPANYTENLVASLVQGGPDWATVLTGLGFESAPTVDFAIARQAETAAAASRTTT